MWDQINVIFGGIRTGNLVVVVQRHRLRASVERPQREVLLLQFLQWSIIDLEWLRFRENARRRRLWRYKNFVTICVRNELVWLKNDIYLFICIIKWKSV